MNMIKDIIKIHGGYSAQVKLKEEFEDRSQNVERMSHYKPIRLTGKPLKLLLKEFTEKTQKMLYTFRFLRYRQIHLCLMTANYLESPSDMPEMEQFFQNYAEAEEEEQIKRPINLRISGKQEDILSAYVITDWRPALKLLF